MFHALKGRAPQIGWALGMLKFTNSPFVSRDRPLMVESSRFFKDI